MDDLFDRHNAKTGLKTALNLNQFKTPRFTLFNPNLVKFN